MGDIHIKGKAHLTGVTLDSTISAKLIDEVPLLAVMATQAKGKTILKGLSELRVKETDRLAALAKNLKAMGARVTEEQDGLIIEGPTPLKGAVVDSFHDHRIAMSFAVASLIAAGETTIRNSECVSISFPTFWDELGRLTAR